VSITFLLLQAGIKFLASNYSHGFVSARSVCQDLREREIHGGVDFVVGTRGPAASSKLMATCCTAIQALSVCRNEAKISR
jgi:hypothetical protein